LREQGGTSWLLILNELQEGKQAEERKNEEIKQKEKAQRRATVKLDKVLSSMEKQIVNENQQLDDILNTATVAQQSNSVERSAQSNVKKIEPNGKPELEVIQNNKPTTNTEEDDDDIDDPSEDFLVEFKNDSFDGPPSWDSKIILVNHKYIKEADAFTGIYSSKYRTQNLVNCEEMPSETGKYLLKLEFKLQIEQKSKNFSL